MPTWTPQKPSPAISLDLILRTIRTVESGNNYTAQNRTSSASGAYQIIDSTWARYGGFAHAKDAPPYVQDQKAASMVQSYLQRGGGDVTAVPQFWYYPAGFGQPNLVPPGNTLSMGQYTDRWMRVYQSLGGAGTTVNLPPSATQLAGFTAPQEHCVLSYPKLGLPGPIPDIGGGCVLASNQARAIGGALILFGGGLVALVGVALLVGKSIPLPQLGGQSMQGIIERSRLAREERQFLRAEQQKRSNEQSARSQGLLGSRAGRANTLGRTVEADSEPF